MVQVTFSHIFHGEIPFFVAHPAVSSEKRAFSAKTGDATPSWKRMVLKAFGPRVQVTGV